MLVNEEVGIYQRLKIKWYRNYYFYVNAGYFYVLKYNTLQCLYFRTQNMSGSFLSLATKQKTIVVSLLSSRLRYGGFSKRSQQMLIR